MDTVRLNGTHEHNTDDVAADDDDVAKLRIEPNTVSNSLYAHTRSGLPYFNACSQHRCTEPNGWLHIHFGIRSSATGAGICYIPLLPFALRIESKCLYCVGNNKCQFC